jgi:hypothetical protein
MKRVFVSGSQSHRTRGLKTCLAALLLLALFVPSAWSQLNWEGQTGALVTPFAYTSPSKTDGVGHPQISFHYLNTGPVIGNDFQLSGTIGLFKIVEVGYTRALSSEGSDTNPEAPLSSLFTGGFNIFHGKVNLVPENAGKNNFIPAISVGFVARTQVQRVYGTTTTPKTNQNDGDIYLVGTKTITQVKGLPIVLNAGVKGTNAVIMGIAGNAGDVNGNSAWVARAFGAVGFVLPGPAKSKLVVGSEAAQQPHYLYKVPGPTIPTTLTYFLRVLPPGKIPINFDLGVVQAAGNIADGVDLKARHQVGMGISYRF